MSFRQQHIILDCDLMKYPNSGLYHYCLNLGNEMSDLLTDDPGYRISFYTPSSARNDFNRPASAIVERKGWWNYFKPFMRGCTIWHAPFQSGRVVPDKRNFPGLKVLLTIHDLNPLHEGKPEEEQKKSLAHTQSLIDKADALVCISDFTKSDVLTHCKTGNKPVHVIHNGTHQVHAPVLRDNSYRPSRPFLFGMGYVNRKKNYHVLLPLLENESIELVIAGKLDESDYVNNMLETAEAMGVSDRLRFTGPVSEGEKAWYYQHCLAFVHPSLAEGFGAPVVEVMQFGKPLFLSALTSLPEIGGEAAFYFSSFEKEHMHHVFRKGMEKYNSNGLADYIRNRGAAFDWKQKAKEYLAVYRSLSDQT
jgi:glycosyltransferase involved in cell wall biosynthesis